MPNPYEMKIAGFGMILISTAISIHTVRWFRKTIINIEQREKRVNSSYKQVLELNQILTLEPHWLPRLDSWKLPKEALIVESMSFRPRSR